MRSGERTRRSGCSAEPVPANGRSAGACYDRIVILLLGVLLLAPPQDPLRPPAAKPAAQKPGPAAGASAPAPARRPAPSGLSWDESDDLARTVARVERRLRAGRPAADEAIALGERQLNSYVNLELGSRIPAGVSDLQLRLQKDRVAAHATLDLDRVKGKLPAGAASTLLAFMSGVVPVEISGRFSAANGSGRLEIEQASVGGVSLPPSMIAQLVSLSTRSEAQPGGVDLLAPFPLPWTARSVRLEPGRALVDFAR